MPSGPTISFKINNLDAGFSSGDIQGEHWFVQSGLSREVACGVFYLRWLLPKQLHPQKKASTLKLSLQTRDPRKALRLSRYLSQIGERLNEYGIACGMRHEELRSVLTEHFRQWLDEMKSQMNDTGPLSELDRQTFETSKRVAKHARKTDTPLSLIKSDDDLLARFIQKYDLDIQEGSSEYGWLDREMKLSFHGFAKAVLAYDKSLQRYDFENVLASPAGDIRQTAKTPGMSIAEVAAAYPVAKFLSRAR
ncbi:hypothetical protein PY650_31615 [Rhizobium calliandrae]|uniref:Integrase n=1 Tax=Rhizobium calliandrae TaxID=1312182 RepID=A0ABT7KN86_9HYPH|nr:hypothetical protein [Rhizobium calliandrae]